LELGFRSAKACASSRSASWFIADEGGLDSIWAADHLFHEPATGPRRGIWENWTIMTALAEATQRVGERPKSLTNARRPTRDP
jgi:alkanesulfonate monooxygenase SsuD/methylene tetrahydromethanopterin reductase-like flavin-dependent oxidoreductase (luciferase family)